MSHARQQIRDALAIRLTGLASTGARVFVSRAYPLSPSDLPALLVRTDDEVIEPLDLDHPATLNRSLTATVEAVARATADLDDTLDAIVAEVETALAGDRTLGGLVKDMLPSALAIELDGAGDQPIGRARLSVTIDYMTLSNAPGTAI